MWLFWLACQSGPAPELRIQGLALEGEGRLPVSLDGYGQVSGLDWAADGALLESNPHLAQSTPDFYLQGGAPLAFASGASPGLRLLVELEEGLPQGSSLRVIGRMEEADAVRWQAELPTTPGAHTLLLEPSGPLPTGPFCGDLALEYIVSTGEERFTIDESSHRLYVSLDQPAPDTSLHHSALELSCAASGLQEEGEIVAAIWAEFSDRDVRRARDQAQLFYYEARDAGALVSELLLAQHGECHSWVQLMTQALRFHGLETRAIGVTPKRPAFSMQVGSWEMLTGAHFVSTGADGICDSQAAGDDLQPIPMGQGRPHTLAIEREPEEDPSFGGDDGFWDYGWVVSGANGVSETSAADLGPDYVPLVPLGFGTANGRAYAIDVDPSQIQVEGDDRIFDQFVLTGADGVLQTPMQPGLSDSFYTEILELGQGYSSTYDNSVMARPELRLSPQTQVGGDDDAFLYGVSSGADGVVQSTGEEWDRQRIPVGQGEPRVPCIGSGPDGVLDSEPSGDDTLLDYSKYFEDAPEEYVSVVGLSMWQDALIPAQGGQHAPTVFSYHYLVEVGGQLYDPSYGSGPYASVEAWSAVSVAGASDSTGYTIDGIHVHIAKAEPFIKGSEYGLTP